MTDGDGADGETAGGQVAGGQVAGDETAGGRMENEQGGDGRPSFTGDPAAERMMAAVMRLAMELQVLRDRLDTHEALAEAGAYSREDVEAFAPDKERAARRTAARIALIDGLMKDFGHSGG